MQIANASGGANRQDPSNFQKALGFNPTITIKPGAGARASTEFIRYLLVMEVTEASAAQRMRLDFGPLSGPHPCLPSSIDTQWSGPASQRGRARRQHGGG
jgi:hypothetical protein